MSLEEAVKANTAAVTALTELLRTADNKRPIVTGPQSGRASSDDPKVTPPPAPAAAPPTPTPPAPAAGSSAPSPKTPTLADVSAAVLALVKAKGRAAAVSALGAFTGADGKLATNAKHLKPEDYLAFIDAAAKAGAAA